jgi:hypothetical protein
MVTVSEICDALGRKEIERQLGVSKAAVSNAVSKGFFAASWYAVISDMCGYQGIACPNDLFSFKLVEASPDMPEFSKMESRDV